MLFCDKSQLAVRWQLLLITGIAMGCAASLGIPAGLSVGWIVLDGCVYGALWMVVCFLLSRTLCYNRQRLGERGLWVQYALALGALVCVGLMGTEGFFVYLTSAVWWEGWKEMWLPRLLLTALLYALLLLNDERGSLKRISQESCGDEEVTSLPLVEKDLSPVPPVELLTRINVKTGQKIKLIPVEEILFLKAEGDYVDIYTAEGHYLKEQTLKHFEEHLPPEEFLRIHRSYIVYLPGISRIERYGQQQLVELRNGTKLKISAAGYKLLKSRLAL